jgi:dipeptidyl aminopeptidase/acylaminoacyl peptidase
MIKASSSLFFVGHNPPSRVKTPTLSLAGARDQNTPPTQALEFHRALRENGVESALALYPNGVHGLMTFPENTDATTRTIGWFLKHLGSR